MWTHLLLTTSHVWDDLHWRLDATWRDDAESDPVHLHQEGTVSVAGRDSPIDFLAAVTAALRAERTRNLRQRARTEGR